MLRIFQRWVVKAINSFMSWVGGKKALRDEILARFPLEYKRYIEVFGGAGWVLFHKLPGNDFEVFNDFNGNLVNLYRCVRELPDKLKDELRYILNSRLDFEYMKHVLHSQAVLPDVRRAAFYGQNAFFYDAAEGLMTSVILLIAEFAEPKERHIVSVFKLIQELMAPSSVKGKNHFQLLLDRLPPDHKARWFAGAALSAGDQAMASVMSTALSRLNSFLDTEMEQVLCFDTAVDAERFCQEKSAIFVVMPEENPNAYFMISLLIQQLYREILSVADENGGKLPNRVMFYCDEFGTMPPIQSAEMMYSASRSRRLSIVSIIQSYQQLEKNYGREGAAIIQDNCQITIAGGFAPTSETADIVSKTLGSRTVLTGSVSRSKNDPSQSLQMTERPLMSADELKNMKKGSFIVMKTGTHPFVSPLKLFFKWGISFSDTPYTVAEHGARKVCYVSRAKIIQAITSQFPQAKKPQPKTEPNNGGPDMTERQPKVPATVRTG